jgi:thioredoxin 1
MLQTNLKHVETDDQFQELVKNHDNVMLCCGRMGPMCIPVYDIMENLEEKYENVEFQDMAFDEAVSNNIRRLPEVRDFMGLPFTLYYKNGEIVEATSGIQNKSQVTEILDKHFGRN